MLNHLFARLIKALSRRGSPTAGDLNNMARMLEDVVLELRHDQGRFQELENLVRHVTDQPRLGGEENATTLERMLGELVKSQQDHQAWLTNLSQRLTSDRLTSEQLTSGDHIVHLEISKRYCHLISQQLLDVVATSGTVDTLAEARFRAGLARALFKPSSIASGPWQALEALNHDGIPVSAEAFQSLWDEAERIRAEAAASGHGCRWLFEVEPGSGVNTSMQEPYEGCYADDPVAFAVAPAYIVDDKVYVKQLVFTQPARPGPRASSA